MNISREREGKGRRGFGGILTLMSCATALWFTPPLHKHFDRIPLTGYDKCNPGSGYVYSNTVIGKVMTLQALDGTADGSNDAASDVPDE